MSTDGMADVMTQLTDPLTGEGTTSGSIVELMELHYNDKEISKETLDWALARIDKPYPSDVTKSLQSTLQAVDDEINPIFSFNPFKLGFFESGAEREQIRSTQDTIIENVSSDLLTYTDREINEGRMPSPKELSQKAAEFSVGAREAVRDESPFEEFPNAYFENGTWYVIKDGKRYRVEQ